MYKRIKQLKTGNPNEIFLLFEYDSQNYKQIERSIHKKYCGDNVSGEWFNINMTDMTQMIDDIKKIDDTLSFMKKHNYFMNGNNHII